MSSFAKAAISDAAEELAKLIRAREAKTPGYWDFTDSPRRGGGHAFFQYPAMMVPELQGALLDDLLVADPSVRSVYDPFMGSGTVRLESIYGSGEPAPGRAVPMRPRAHLRTASGSVVACWSHPTGAWKDAFPPRPAM